MLNVSRFIQIPYVSGGRDFDGCDCYGLVRLALKELKNIELPSYSNDYEDCENSDEISRLINIYRPLLAGERKDEPNEGDLAIFSYGGVPCHIGLYIGGGRVLHILRKTGFSVCEKLNSPYIRGRLEGFYGIESN